MTTPQNEVKVAALLAREHAKTAGDTAYDAFAATHATLSLAAEVRALRLAVVDELAQIRLVLMATPSAQGEPRNRGSW